MLVFILRILCGLNIKNKKIIPFKKYVTDESLVGMSLVTLLIKLLFEVIPGNLKIADSKFVLAKRRVV